MDVWIIVVAVCSNACTCLSAVPIAILVDSRTLRTLKPGMSRHHRCLKTAIEDELRGEVDVGVAGTDGPHVDRAAKRRHGLRPTSVEVRLGPERDTRIRRRLAASREDLLEHSKPAQSTFTPGKGQRA